APRVWEVQVPAQEEGPQAEEAGPPAQGDQAPAEDRRARLPGEARPRPPLPGEGPQGAGDHGVSGARGRPRWIGEGPPREVRPDAGGRLQGGVASRPGGP